MSNCEYHRLSIFQQTNSAKNQMILSTMNHSDHQNQFNAHVNVNFNNQYWLQLQDYRRFIVNQRKPVGVFWDIENCSIPRGVSPSNLIEKIRSFIVRFNLIEKEFSIVCDVPSFASTVINELNNTQVNIIHVSSFAKNAADEKLKQLILRFVQSNGQNCAVILFSSDINFVPVLSDIKNRLGVLVILFHHQQVSSALLQSSHYHFDYDQFCLTNTVNVQMNHHPLIDNQSDFIMTSLRISNLPSAAEEEQIKGLLNRIIGNNGGRITYLDMINHEAIVRFKCRSDALRCHQRVDNRKFYGHILKSKFEPNFIQSNQNTSSSSFVNHYSSRQINDHQQSLNRVNSESRPTIRTTTTTTTISQPTISESFVKRAAACTICSQNQNYKQSKNHNFLFSNQIFSINIDFNFFCRRLCFLLSSHDGKIPLNSFPDCWLETFETELDDINDNDGPKVMLEHLITCVPNVSIRNMEIEIDQQEILTKFIVFNESSDHHNQQSSSSSKRSKLLKKFMLNLHSLLRNQTSNKTTCFPSIELSDLVVEYRRHFDENIIPRDYGFSDLIELLESCGKKFNIYSYGYHRIVALNFKEQALRFMSHLARLYPFNLSDPNYFDDLDPAFYGACSIEDMITAIDLRPNLVKFIYDKNRRLALFSYPLVQNSAILDEFNVIKTDLKKTLLSMQDFSINCSKFREDFSQLIHKKLNVKMNYCRLSNLIINHSGGDLEIMTHSLPFHDRLMLSVDLQLMELGKRFLKIFNEMAVISYGESEISDHHHNERNVAIPIYDLIYHYHRRYESFSLDNLGIKSLSKLFEKILVNSSFENYCLIYTSSTIFLNKFSHSWRQRVLHLIFTIIVHHRSSNGMITFDELKQHFHNHLGFSFGLSLFCDQQIGKMIQIIKDDNNELIVKLNQSCEFAAKCLTVMLLHEKIVFPHCISSNNGHPLWTLDQIENEFYDHFGVSMAYSNPTNGGGQSNLIDSFASFDWLFEIRDFQCHTILIKEIDWFHYDLSTIPRCNYCESQQSEQQKSLSEEIFEKFLQEQSSSMMIH
ncbi:hypothetical protein DERF_002532 [Dermatophagoides farinae]|uniref:Meiosis regulator and mRNA stability factor 1 n=1 Tax=Dermatophagoides farinae TaxID=6954 RepID=A0A922ICM1_DERFA|nr:hypothetical protein HUG17_10500 [Dermatophagoides farinae]KAH9528605.1 hypothetical protein DERF_002532 [Dermatophagoides farinae]